MLLLDVVQAASAVGATRSRLQKVTVLQGLLATATLDELPVLTGFLVGSPRQGRIGVGWASVLRETNIAAPVDAALTVLEVDEVMWSLAEEVGEGSVGRRREILDALKAKATESEWEFLQHLFLGDMRIGALEGIVLDAVAASAGVPVESVRRAYLLTGELGSTAQLARGGVDVLDAVRLEVMRPIQPMLAATSRDVGEAVGELGSVSVEWKLDGARVQVHRQGDDVKIVTRNLNDVTDRLPEVVKIVRALSVSSVVLDGEVLRVRTDGRPVAFQDTMSRFGSDGERVEAAETSSDGLRPYFFDCMHVNGVDLLDEPFAVRREALERTVGPYAVPALATTDPQAAQRFADDTLALGHEGVMVKAASSVYEAGRRGSTWRKVKPVRTLDLVVLAAEWGHGRRQGWLSNLHLGARSVEGDGFVMVGKTFKGLTDAVLAWQTEALLAREERRTGITVWVRPELVVEIALDGVLRSTRYPGGVALRFARVKSYRPDRTPDSADSITSVRALLV